MNSVKRFAKIISFLASTGFFFSASPAYSQLRLSPGFESVSRQGYTGVCGTPSASHKFFIQSEMKIGITVTQSAQDDPTFLIRQLSPLRKRITTQSSQCGEDDEPNNTESDTFRLLPGNYEINVGNYKSRQTKYKLEIYECKIRECKED